MRARVAGRRFLLALALLAAGAATAPAQDARPNSALLVARPTLVDPNFRETVVLVTQAPDASTVGVILNRPTRLDLADFLPPSIPAEGYRESVYEGGPVMRQVILAVFESEATPPAPAFRVLDRLWLSMHPRNVAQLLRGTPGRYRLYAGFSGWAPRQLQGELLREGWYVLPADEETVFRGDMSSLWSELVRKADGQRTRLHAPPSPENESPAGAGL